MRFLPTHKFTKCLFLTFMGLGILISINANNPLLVWLGLEINLISFLPLLLESNSRISSSNIIKYFLIQAITSLLVLFLIIPFSINIPSRLLTTIFIIALFIKLGIPPYHFWLPSVIQCASWTNCFILSTVQKLAPLFLIARVTSFNKLILIMACLSLIIRSLGGLAQTNLRPLIAYSSIHHIVWCVISVIINKFLLLFYLFAYFLACAGLFFTLNSTQIFNFKSTSSKYRPYMGSTLVTLLSLAGLPPLLGFFPKIFVLINVTTVRVILTLIILFCRTINLCFYFNFRLSVIFLKTFTYKPQTLPSIVIIRPIILILLPYIIMAPIVVRHSAMTLFY